MSRFFVIRKKAVNRLAQALCLLALLAAVIPLAAILIDALGRGGAALNWAFFTALPKPVGESGGGMVNAIAGSAILVVLASIVGLPFGIFSGIYLAEFGDHRLGHVIRFLADVLSGIPSIVVGIFAYALLVLPFRHFSALAGGFALGLMMIPTITRTTEELILRVPTTLREGALALGIPYWKMVLRVVLRAVRGGILTGILLSIARIMGETAPLLFTAFGNRFWSIRLFDPIAALPLQIFSYALSPFDDWHRQAWAGALVLIAFVLGLNLTSRLVIRMYR